MIFLAAEIQVARVFLDRCVTEPAAGG